MRRHLNRAGVEQYAELPSLGHGDGGATELAEFWKANTRSDSQRIVLLSNGAATLREVGKAMSLSH
jgi:hypothetical protein